MTTMANAVAEGFTEANALATLLTTEGLLFAALGLAANLATPTGRRVRKLPVPGEWLGAGAVTVLVLVAIGAGVAWAEIFLCDFPSAIPGIVIAITLLVAIIAQPVLAVLLGLGLRTAR